MSSECEWVEAHAAELVRGELPEPIAAHLEGCPSCRAVEEGARALRVDLDGWTVPEPRADLVERTLARLAMAPLAAPAEEEESGLAPIVPLRRRRRTSVEILTSPPLDDGPLLPPSRGRLVLRLFVQSAAALLLFGVCTAFVATFYPAVTHALEDRRVHRCQEQLLRLREAALRYHAERPDAPDLRGQVLRRALIEGGYADELDFVCPGSRGQELRERSYVGSLPGGSAPVPGDRPIYWDRFGNHSSGFNVVYADSRVETVEVEDFASWMLRVLPRD